MSWTVVAAMAWRKGKASARGRSEREIYMEGRNDGGPGFEETGSSEFVETGFEETCLTIVCLECK